MGNHPPRTEYRSLMDMTKGPPRSGEPIPSLMLFDADSWLSQSGTAPNSLFNTSILFFYITSPKMAAISWYIQWNPQPKKAKKNSTPPQSWPSSQERTALQPEGIRLGYSAKMTQLNTPGILCILSSVGSSFFSLKGFINWNYMFVPKVGNIMINHGLLGCTVFRSNYNG